MIKYKTGGFGESILPVEICRESDSSIWVMRTIRRTKGDIQEERRYAKVSSYERYHDSWEDAHKFLIAQAEGAVRNARLTLEIVNGRLGNIKGMKPPVA